MRVYQNGESNGREMAHAMELWIAWGLAGLLRSSLDLVNGIAMIRSLGS